MPELPEVETIARQLDRVLVGKKISKIEVLREKSFIGNSQLVIGKTIENVDRKAKMLVISFKNWEMKLVVHLKMTGQLIFIGDKEKVVGGHPTPDWVRDLPSKHTRVILSIGKDEKMYFNDLRVFGWLKLMDEASWKEILKKLPPDVTDEGFTEDLFREKIKKSGIAIKTVLLDQSRFGGIGNIYANDALYLAKINPRQKAKEVSPQNARELYLAVKKVINKGIKYGGASIDKYVNASGVGGNYQDHFLVYKRDGEKCKRCGSVIKKIKIGGRGTFFCPECQK